MNFGAEVRDDGTVRFSLWAPSHWEIGIELDEQDPPRAMRLLDEGWHELVTDRARPGTRYCFVLPDGMRVPDPASRYQPKDVHGPSEVVDPATYEWQDGAWRGRAWEEAVVYELHVGAFTPEGTFRAAIGKLDHLVALGVTAIEIMPIADFPGARNWGYDGVLPFAPDSSYGRPEDLKALVDAAHAKRLMVLLDVVYNHFGPEGAYLHAIAPETFTNRHKTPWGAAINMDGPKSGPVREYFFHNALYWLEEFHLDGLRLDAVHAIVDDRPKHFIEELAEHVRAAWPDRQIHLILENEENAARRLRRGEHGKPIWYTAQWNDDVHHVLHVAASGDSQGYYADYVGDTEKLGRALAEGFAFQGEVMPYRGTPRGEPSGTLPPTAFVAFIQNHDQVGNRPFGDRLTAIASPEAVRAVAAVYLLLPQIPMLFMGEEWAAAQPFPFFCDFGDELAEAVRNGRREEFARFPGFQDPATRERIPDPTAEETFASAKLAWDDVLTEPHAAWLQWYCQILATRHASIVPLLRQIRRGGRYEVIGDRAVLVRWHLDESSEELVLAANLSDTSAHGFPPASGSVLWREGGEDRSDGSFPPWSVRWSVSSTGALDELAERMGIESEFRDARGETVRTRPETKRDLLAIMGHVASAGDAALASLAALERAEWMNPLPPILVVRPDLGPALIDLTLPAGTTSVSWTVTLEDGGTREGRGEFGHLEWIARHEMDGGWLERRRLVVDCDLPWGYHRLTIQPGGDRMILVSTPGRCWLPDALREGQRLWGIAAQLYLLRSADGWGIGDFTDLRQLVELAASRGADVIGLNPLHGMFVDNPGHASPYSPASRLILNVLNIDVTAIARQLGYAEATAFIESEQFRARIASCQARHLVDYDTVAELKLSALERVFNAFSSASQADGPRQDVARRNWEAFERFRREQGNILEANCLFMALREHFAAAKPARADWHCWPEEYRHPTSEAVLKFKEKNNNRLDFWSWLQWVADQQLGAAAAIASKKGMVVGLYRDLAIGADRSGAEAWINPEAIVSEARVGAPPDIYNPGGQDWGLPPFHPHVMLQQGYRGFIDLVRANMRHAGGLRIDHVMALQHLWWVPAGKQPADGGYVRYPLDDLVGILALESHRHHCLVVGEDLGTVPQGFRERMADANILSYQVIFFEQDPGGAFLPPKDYPRLALSVAGSHDLPTIRAWWDSGDLDLKARLRLYPTPEDETGLRVARARDRKQLLRALHREGIISSTEEPDDVALTRAVHAYLARTTSALAMAQIDDLTGEYEPVNVPTTSTEHPNWRRRLRMTLDELARNPEFNEIARIFNAERGAQQGRPDHHG